MSLLHRRRFLSVGAAAALGSAWSVAGCGQSSREAGRTVATLWFSYGGKNREVLLSMVERFNRSQGRYFVRATFQGDYFEALAKLRTALAAGVAPTFSHVVGEVIPYLAGANVLEPLDHYEGASSLGLVPALSQLGSFEGGRAHPTVAIPFNRSTPIMYMNQALMERARIEPPRTWQALREAALALTRRTEGDLRWGYEVPISWWFWVAMVGQAGGSVLDANGVATLGGAAGERALRFWQDLVHTDRVMRPPAGRDYNAWQATNQDFLAGRAAIIWTSTAFLRYLEQNASFPVLAAPLPRDVTASVPTGGTFFVILKTAPQPAKQAAWQFLRWMTEPAQTIEWASRTGYLPVSQQGVQQLEERGYYAAHPNDRVAYEQLADVQPWPWAPNLFRIQRDAVEPRLEEAVLTNRDARRVLDEARAAANEP